MLRPYDVPGRHGFDFCESCEIGYNEQSLITDC